MKKETRLDIPKNGAIIIEHISHEAGSEATPGGFYLPVRSFIQPAGRIIFHSVVGRRRAFITSRISGLFRFSLWAALVF